MTDRVTELAEKRARLLSHLKYHEEAAEKGREAQRLADEARQELAHVERAMAEELDTRSQLQRGRDITDEVYASTTDETEAKVPEAPEGNVHESAHIGVTIDDTLESDAVTPNAIWPSSS